MSMVKVIISITISLIVLATVFMPQINSVNTDDWSSGEVALLGAVSTIILAGFVYWGATGFGMT